jgi:hypothetical protein
MASCEKDVIENGKGDDNGTAAKSGYVIAATVSPDGGTSATYLLGAETLGEGNLSPRKVGFEATDGTWVFYADKALYNLQYNQGSAGVTESYVLTADGQIKKRPGVYNVTRFTAYGVVGDNIVTASAVNTDQADASGNKAKGLGFNFLNAASETATTKTLPGEDFLGNGEFVTFAGFVEANGKVYTSVIPQGMSKWGVQNYKGAFNHDKVAAESGGQNSGAYEKGEIPGTQYPDMAFIAIYDNKSFDGKPIIVQTDQMGYACGRYRAYNYQTIWAADNGDVYAFSPGYGRVVSGPYYTTGTKGASVMRIKSGATQFDADFGTVDLETLAGGYSFFRTWHITGDYFLLSMYTGTMNARGTGVTRLAVFKGSDKSFHYVDGIPAPDQVTSFGSTPFAEGGYIYMPIVAGGEHAIYQIDPATHSATKGLVVDAQSIGAVGRLTAQ